MGREVSRELMEEAYEWHSPDTQRFTSSSDFQFYPPGLRPRSPVGPGETRTVFAPEAGRGGSENGPACRGGGQLGQHCPRAC